MRAPASMSRAGLAGAALAGLATVTSLPASASAVAPGTNGPLFYSTSNEIFRIAPDGTDNTNLTNTPAIEERPSVTADGSRVTFMAFDAENPEIWRIDGDGDNRTQLTFTAGINNYEPGYSPDGTKIIFARQTAPVQDIWRIDSNGGNPINLTNTPFPGDGTHSDECCAEYSPNAGKIAYSNGFNSDPTEAESNDIWVMNADGSNQQALTGPHDAPIQDIGPSWSPDGTKLVFSRSGTTNGTDGLYLIDVDGTDLTPVMNGPSIVQGYAPTFSPDGTLIAYSSGSGIATVPAGGGAPVGLVLEASANYPTWAGAGGSPPDTTPPNTSISSGPSGLINTRDASFGFSSSEAGSTFQCRLDGGAFGSCSSPKSYTGLADGDHTFDVRAIDAATNVDPTPARATFRIDATAPETTITSGPSGATTKRKAKFRFTSSEPGSSFRCQLDGNAPSSCTSPKRYNGLSRGKHKFSVVATDGAGNADATAAKRKFRVKRP